MGMSRRVSKTTMRALYFDGTLRLDERPRPDPPTGEALIRVTTTGVCNTDIEILKGYMGFQGVPGHEFVGVVEAAANDHLIGKRVVGEINCTCGVCRYCTQEMPHHCSNRTTLGIDRRHGSFAEYLTLPESNLHLVPEGVSDEVAVFTEPVAAAFRILEQIAIASDDRVVVLGDGKLGQLITQVLALHSEHVVCVGHHDWKLDFLRRLGIATAAHVDAVDPEADVVVEATGSPEGFAQALELVRPEGAIVLKTTIAGNTPANLTVPVVNEVRLIGSRCGPFRPALEALSLGTVDVRPLVTETYAIEDGVTALERAVAPDVMKVLIRM